MEPGTQNSMLAQKVDDVLAKLTTLHERLNAYRSQYVDRKEMLTLTQPVEAVMTDLKALKGELENL